MQLRSPLACRLGVGRGQIYDETAKLDEFNLVDDGVDHFQVTHLAKKSPKLKSTTVKPTLLRL
ncbi:MAG: hypothetical protein ACJAT6_001723 [Akkermansiaceae bacterium]|jgi:hypothetical protein|tara:strand:- start:494 stop:682 length:189 start_codon:yes stop_codon:yes gene_type:complete